MKKYPFRLLDAYRQEDKDIFFGREEEIEKLYQIVFQSKIILVYGGSGTGKTSLIQCGLANKFKEYDWKDIYVRRGANINHSLDKALCDATEGIFTFDSKQLLNELKPKIETVYRNVFRPIYLIFDQFEELYILGNKDEQRLFVNTVKELLKVEQPLKIIFSIREEYLGYLYEFEKEVPELLRKKLRVEPMNLDKVSGVLMGISNLPQSLIRLEQGREREIAEQVFEKVKDKERSNTIQLPYLQMFLDKLYLRTTQDKERETDATFTLEALRQMGNIGNVLMDFLNNKVQEIANELKHKEEEVWQVLAQFITEEGTKEPLSFAQLQERLKDEEALDQDFLQKIISGFEGSRILRKSEDGQLYEITHDSLAKQISEKQSAEDKAKKDISSFLQRAIKDYQDRQSLLRDEDLNYLEKNPYFKRIQSTWEEEEEALVNKSYGKIRQEKRWKKSVTIGLILLTIFSVVAGGFSFYSFFQAIKATNAAISAKKDAEANLSEAYKAQIATIEVQMAVAERNVQSFKQFDANDLVAFENRKLKILNHQKDSLLQLIKQTAR